jgi:glutamine cyclotransferase
MSFRKVIFIEQIILMEDIASMEWHLILIMKSKIAIIKIRLFITGKKWPYIYEIKFKNVV